MSAYYNVVTLSKTPCGKVFRYEKCWYQMEFNSRWCTKLHGDKASYCFSPHVFVGIPVSKEELIKGIIPF